MINNFSDKYEFYYKKKMDTKGMQNPIFKLMAQQNEEKEMQNPLGLDQTGLQNPFFSEETGMINENLMNNMGNMNNMMMNNNMNGNLMNNMGNMNNMMISQMGESLMGTMEMNNRNFASMNQTMVMDEDAQRLKGIIKPYENRIKELEEINRKNNFTITVLKDKLNQMSHREQQLEEELMMNNMNDMNNMMNNIDNYILNISFEYGLDVQKINCLNDELVLSIINKYCKKNGLDQKSLFFYFNNKIIPNDSTAFEIGLGNNSIIEVVDKTSQNFINFLNNNNFINNFNLNFDNLNRSIDSNNNDNDNDEKKINLIFNYQGKKEVIFLGENSLVGDGLRAFLEKKDIDEDDYKHFTFVYDDKNLFLDDERKLKDIFFGVHAQINVLGK